MNEIYVENKKAVLNLTQHKVSEEQEKQGVIEPSEEDKKKIKELLTFEELPNSFDMKLRAIELVSIAKKYNVEKVMIGGAPYFMPYLEQVLLHEGLTPLHAFTKRIIVEEKDGKKTAIFKHEGFIEGGGYL